MKCLFFHSRRPISISKERIVQADVKEGGSGSDDCEARRGGANSRGIGSSSSFDGQDMKVRADRGIVKIEKQRVKESRAHKSDAITEKDIIRANEGNSGLAMKILMESSKPKILITEALPLIEEEKKALEKQAFVKLATDTSEDTLIRESRDVTVIMVVYAKITKRIIALAENLRGIVRYGIGIDNIDLVAAREKGVVVTNVPDYCVGTVADHTFALLLALSRKVLVADHMMRTGNYGSWTSPIQRLRGVDCDGKQLGLIGLGKIGKAVAERARSFGMRVVTYDPYVSKDLANSLSIGLVDIGSLLANSDFVSIHVPLTPATKGLIGEKELRSMKKKSYLINTSRGSVIDEKALFKALKEGWIAGAALDVFEKEPPDPRNPLFGLDNVILTPHIAYYTEESIRRLEMAAVEDTILILSGKPPKNLIQTAF